MRLKHFACTSALVKRCVDDQFVMHFLGNNLDQTLDCLIQVDPSEGIVSLHHSTVVADKALLCRNLSYGMLKHVKLSFDGLQMCAIACSVTLCEVSNRIL